MFSLTLGRCSIWWTLIGLMALKLPPLQMSLGRRFHVYYSPMKSMDKQQNLVKRCLATWYFPPQPTLFHRFYIWVGWTWCLDIGYLTGVEYIYIYINISRTGSDSIVRCYELLFDENKTHLPNRLSGHMWVVFRKIFGHFIMLIIPSKVFVLYQPVVWNESVQVQLLWSLWKLISWCIDICFRSSWISFTYTYTYMSI